MSLRNSILFFSELLLASTVMPLSLDFFREFVSFSDMLLFGMAVIEEDSQFLCVKLPSY